MSYAANNDFGDELVKCITKADRAIIINRLRILAFRNQSDMSSI